MNDNIKTYTVIDYSVKRGVLHGFEITYDYTQNDNIRDVQVWHKGQLIGNMKRFYRKRGSCGC